jgi:hypothetical protein
MKAIPTAILATLLALALLKFVSTDVFESTLSPSLHSTWIGETEKNRSRKS